MGAPRGVACLVHADQQTRDKRFELRIICDGHHGATTIALTMRKNEIVGIAHIGGAARDVRLTRRVNTLADIVGKIRLRRCDAGLAKEKLEVDVRRATGIPTRIHGFECNAPVRIRHLRPAQECLSFGRNVAAGPLLVISRIRAARVGMPDIDTNPSKGFTIRMRNDAQHQLQRRAGRGLSDLSPIQFRIEVKRAFDGLWQQHTLAGRHCRRGRCSPAWGGLIRAGRPAKATNNRRHPHPEHGASPRYPVTHHLILIGRFIVSAYIMAAVVLRSDFEMSMLRKDIKKVHAAASTADPTEIARFNKLAEDWWKPDGAFKVVHAFNAVRVAYLTEQLPRLMGRDTTIEKSLTGLTIADIGCGAGIVTEPLSRLGATTLGIDAAERNVMVATHHATQANAPVSYRHAMPEDLVAEGHSFDIVLSLEVVEHVADVAAFLDALAALVKPGGLLVIGTLNRTPVSYVKAIVGAEYVLGWLPRGTHEWRKFVTPGELDAHLARKAFTIETRRGVELNPLNFRWGLSASVSTNYIQIHRRAAS